MTINRHVWRCISLIGTYSDLSALSVFEIGPRYTLRGWHAAFWSVAR